MRGISRFLCVCLALVVAQSGWATPPFVPGYPHPYKEKGHVPSAAKIHAFGNMRAATIANATGTKNVAVIIVQFPAGCASCTSGSRSILNLANINTNFVTNMSAYYNEVSRGQITLAFKFFGPNTGTVGGDSSAAVAGAYTLGNPMEYYGCGDEGPGSSGQASCNGISTPAPGSANGDYLIHDALVAARAGHGNTPASPAFDEVIVVHAGNGNETTSGTNGDIWSIFYSQDSVISSAGAGFDEGDVVPETETGLVTSPLGVMCHEFGHSLGLPDLYNTEFGSSVVGYWELMDFGPYASAGTNPSHMSVWDKQTLGWLTPSVATSTQTATFNAIETSPSAWKLPVQNGSSQEYFLVEYRRKAAPGAIYDAGIPGTGLLVWHVDDAITSTRGINATDPGVQNTVNTGSPHYGVSIVSADGVFVGSTHGTATNPYGNGQNFTSPSSNNFAGQASGISMVNISGVGGASVSAEVANLATSATQSIALLINYPNPAGKNYPHPNGAGHTTLQMQLTRPANDYSFNIYTLSGELVRKIGASEISLNLNRSSNNTWVYEFVWDLTNGDGKMVAPGVYLYLARADGVSKSAKAVIIR